MHLDAARSRLVERWNEAAADLGIAIESPFECRLESGRLLHVPVLIRDFGAARGMLVDSSGLAEFERELVQAGYGYSEMSPPRPGERYEREVTIEVLRDWGWTGPLAARPSWLEPPPIRLREPQLTMCAGTRDSCAIEAVVEADADPDWIFGRLFLWIAGCRLGHDNGCTALNGCRNWIEALAENEVDRRVPEFVDLDAGSILALVERAVFVDAGPEHILRAAETCDLTHIGMDALEAYEILLLEDRDGLDRVVWKRTDSNEVHEARFAPGTVRQLAAEFVERFDAATRRSD